MKKVLVTLPEDLLAQADEAAKNEGLTRSAFIRDALCLAVRMRHKLEVEERMKRGYEEMAAINLGLARQGLDADNRALESYEASLSEDDNDVDKKGRDIPG